MLDPSDVPDVTLEELLARYVVYQSHIRKKNDTLKADAFIPHPHEELSVTRHREASEDEIWIVGVGVATQRSKMLRGRGDVLASACLAQELQVIKKPILPDNPNHADISDWPSDKPAQKLIAQEIAANATFVAVPP